MLLTRRGKRKVQIVPEVGKPSEYLIPKGKRISVLEGDYLRAGEALMDGQSNPHDILKVKGEKELARYLVNVLHVGGQFFNSLLCFISSSRSSGAT